MKTDEINRMMIIYIFRNKINMEIKGTDTFFVHIKKAFGLIHKTKAL